jgi:hypothetical protein
MKASPEQSAGNRDYWWAREYVADNGDVVDGGERITRRQEM